MDVLGPSLEIPLYDLLGKRGAVIIASATAQANQRPTANDFARAFRVQLEDLGPGTEQNVSVVLELLKNGGIFHELFYPALPEDDGEDGELLNQAAQHMKAAHGTVQEDFMTLCDPKRLKGSPWPKALLTIEELRASAVPRRTILHNMVLNSCAKAQKWRHCLQLQHETGLGNLVSQSTVIAAEAHVNRWCNALERLAPWLQRLLLMQSAELRGLWQLLCWRRTKEMLVRRTRRWPFGPMARGLRHWQSTTRSRKGG
eukprot:s1266_g12.t1